MVWLGLMASLFVAEMIASLTTRPRPSKSTDAFVVCEAQRLSIWGFCNAALWNVDRRRGSFGPFGLSFAFAFALAFAFLVLVWTVFIIRLLPLIWLRSSCFGHRFHWHGHEVWHELWGSAERCELFIQGGHCDPRFGLQGSY